MERNPTLSFSSSTKNYYRTPSEPLYGRFNQSEILPDKVQCKTHRCNQYM